MSVSISIVICTRNYAHFLREALPTAAAQSFSDFELLIVDDGSTDDTEAVVRQFAPQFSKCVYLKKPHTGLPDSRNFGVRAASGTHVGFLDADDLWSPEYLVSMREVFEKIPEAELVCCDGFRVFDTGEVFGTLFPAGLPPLCGLLRTARELFSFFPYALPSGMIFAKAAYERVGPFDTRYPLGNDDWHWVIRAAEKQVFCVRLDHKLVLYRTHMANLTQQVGGTLEEWLSVYQDRWGGKAAEPETEAWARRITRKHVLGLLARYSPEESRLLLRKAIAVHGGERRLEVAYFLTYFGLCGLARYARRAKHAFSKARPGALRMDLHSPPEMLFAAVSRNS